MAPFRASVRPSFPVAGFKTEPRRVEEERAVTSARDADLEAEPSHKVRRGRGRGARRKNRG